jgi:hypothetical protein
VIYKFENTPEYLGLGTPVLKPDAMSIEELQNRAEEISLDVNGRVNRMPGSTSRMICPSTASYDNIKKNK